MTELDRDGLAQHLKCLQASRRWKITSMCAVTAVAALLIVTAFAFCQRQPPGQREGQTQAGSQFTLDTTGISPTYANYCRVTGTPEELILDFGLNTQMTERPAEPIKVTNRMVMNYYTAKRLVGAMHMAVQQHENAYGILETDIKKRTRSGSGNRSGD